MGVLGYYDIIAARVDDNSMRAIDDNNITEAIEDNMGVIDDGVMGHVEDGESMGAGDYRSIAALGSYNNVGTMLNDRSVELGVCRLTIPCILVTMSQDTAGTGGILSHTKPSYAGNFKRFILFPAF
jgi:hypothetical protein